MMRVVEQLATEELVLRLRIDQAFRGNFFFFSFDLVKFRELVEGHPVGQEEPAQQELVDGLAADKLIEFLKSKIRVDPLSGPVIIYTHDKLSRRLLVSVNYFGALLPSFLDTYI